MIIIQIYKHSHAVAIFHIVHIVCMNKHSMFPLQLSPEVPPSQGAYVEGAQPY